MRLGCSHVCLLVPSLLVLVLARVAAVAMGPHQGLYSREISDYEVVTPRKVSADGKFVSHDVTHHHSRAKRSIADSPEVHYQLPVAGEELHLQLWPSHRFLAPGLTVERRRNGTTVSRTPVDLTSTGCHYHGSVRGQPGSLVSLSACDGLAGLLRTRRGDFWVEPARGHDPVEAAPSSRPHLVFKRAAVSAAAKKRKRKKRKRMEKNCGTKEPPRHEVKLRRKHMRSRARGRRSTSRESHVEALLVADTAMLRFHQDVEKYILTIMNMVSALYLDPSIGNPINVVVVNIMLLESPEESLNITVNADQTLENFCRWQHELNSPDDADALHHDVAILITREDICARQNAPCSTLGVAHVAGMCQPNRSCNVNEDNGITLAHTITHELGHNFGMYHDTEKIGCSRRHGKTLHVMTPSFEADTVDVAWSTCSKRDITNFLDQGLGGCLNDDPGAVNYSYPDQPPGATYNAQQQCRMQFGIHNTSVCSPLEDICKSLWCVVEGMCTTIMRPAAPGTSCGNNMWCQNQECVPVEERPEPVNGGWSEWTPWSDCSRTCGAGVAITERFCDQPVPAHGGKFCTGERRRYKVCNVEDCPDGQPTFRALQCSKYDDQEYNGKKYKWLPYLDKSEPCKLYCTDATEHVILPWNNSVADGTPCYVGDRSMCINGICRHVGCDWVVDSTAEEDRCGICKGDGKLCETKSGLYHRKDGLGYKEVVTIPSGSRHIKVEERGNAKGFISIGSATSGKFYLNDLRHVQLAGEYEVAGTPALYERQRGQESIHIPGPIKDDVRIYVISKGRARNGSVHYEYTVPKSRTSEAPVYHWAFSAWSQCTASCGGGTQMSLPVCYEEGIGRVSEEFCEASERPNQVMRVCNEMPCPSRWWTGEWQPCPVTCGEEAFRKRHILCVAQDHGNSSEEVVLSDSECADEDRPTDEEPCPDLPSCFSLAPTQESRSAPHNTSAEMMLLDEDEIILNSISSPRNHDDILQFMNGGQGEDRTVSGGGWLVSAWSPCTVTCGPGRQVRHVECTHLDGSCDEALKPSDSKPCHVQRYCYVHWVTGPWGPCSATCGSRPAFKWREVRCENIMTGRAMDGCNILMKPDVREACNLPACPAGEDDAESCEDKLLPRLCASLRTRCNWWYMKAKCCRTCMGR
ncbi:A disintegrin and metalloproteinase with thrombospondin motifs 7 [Anabrus simplex]|uniref:A disintegrin and metalloproteinase with thrombospondin motifs 7 n=1 Tax=Anabrus simplex TaxID=316456 RepID=UPI0035A292C0